VHMQSPVRLLGRRPQRPLPALRSRVPPAAVTTTSRLLGVESDALSRACVAPDVLRELDVGVDYWT